MSTHDLRRRLRYACETLALAPDPMLESSIASKMSEVLDAFDEAERAIEKALPLLVKLGDYTGNADERCETIIALKEVLK